MKKLFPSHKGFTLLHRSTNRRNATRYLTGFTMIEVLVAIAISTTLFLSISQLMVNFFRLNTDVQKDLAMNGEKEITYLSLKNFLEEGERVVESIDQGPTTAPRITILNSPDSELLPFSIITTHDSGYKFKDASSTPIQNLVIKNVTLSKVGSSWIVKETPAEREESGYTLDYANNRVIKGTLSSACKNNPSSCACSGTGTMINDCIMVGAEDQSLSYGTIAHAPFIKILHPTDLRLDGTNLFILSPYEGREYKVDTSTLTVTTNDILPIDCPSLTTKKPLKFPYYYDASNKIIDLMDTCEPKWKLSTAASALFKVAAEDDPTNLSVLNHYSVTNIKHVSDVYTASTPSTNFYTLDRFEYTLTDPLYSNEKVSMNTDPMDTRNQSRGFLLKLFLK